MTKPRIVIVGGGLAGLATAVALAKRNIPATLLESRPRLGGRATSIRDRITGELIDNCQHVNMGCCVNFQRLCEWTETSSLLTTENELQFIDRSGHRSRFANSWLPAPAHLATSFLRYRSLNFADKRNLGRALSTMMRSINWPGDSLRDFLHHQRQSGSLLDHFWGPILVSALSEDPECISYQYARQVIIEGFLRHRNGWKVQLLTVPLSQFYDDALRKWLEQKGVVIRLKSGVETLKWEHDDNHQPKMTGVKLKSGAVVSADQIVLTVPWHRATSLLSASLLEAPSFQRLTRIEQAPITSVHFWYDRPITSLRHAVLLNRTSQWMFNRTAILNQESEAEQDKRYAYQIVISNSREVRNRADGQNEERLSQQELINLIERELKEVWPDAQNARLQHARVITEHQAVFSPRPEIDSLRPPQQTEIPNLFLAGDWTQTGWPATMEGAVRSGFLAAEHLLRQKGLANDESCQFLAPELKPTWLSRVLINS